MFPAAVDPAAIAGGAIGLIGAAAITGLFSYKAAVAKTKGDREVSEQARLDTTATASAFDTTVHALARASAEAVTRADRAEATAAAATAGLAERTRGEQRCLDQFAAHREATIEQIDQLKGVIRDLLDRVGAVEADGHPRG